MKQITIQKIKVFEAEIDASMTQKEILKVFKKIENVQYNETRSQRGYKTVTISDGNYYNGTCHRVEFKDGKLETIRTTVDKTQYESPRLVAIRERHR